MIVRTDLSPPQQSVQAAHAVLEASRNGILPVDLVHPHIIICGVADEMALAHQHSRIKSAGIKALPFFEPDRAGEMTALATEPLFGDKRRHMRKLRLLGA